MENKSCYIIGAGEISRLDIAPNTNDYVIAADGGYQYLLQYGIRTDFIMGDFDSLTWIPEGQNVLRFNKEKDDTDMMLAVKHALSRGYRQIHIYGGTGGRFSHTFSNIQALAYIAACGGYGCLYGDHYRVTVITNGEFLLQDGESYTVSVFAYNGEARGITIEGMKYTLDDATLTCTNPLGTSNETIGDTARIQVTDGSLVIVWEPRTDDLVE